MNPAPERKMPGWRLSRHPGIGLTGATLWPAGRARPAQRAQRDARPPRSGAGASGRWR
jgi:hypothetical protein